MTEARIRRLPRWPARDAWARAAAWLPFGGVVALLAVLAAGSRLHLDLFTLLLVGAAALPGLAALRRWSPLIVLALLLAPLAWHFSLALPRAQCALQALPPGGVVHLEAIVRDREALPGTEPRRVRLLLGNAALHWGGGSAALAELEVELPAESPWPFRSGRAIRMAGRLAVVTPPGHRLRLDFSAAVHDFDDAPAWAWGEAWRVRLADRGAYYLTRRAAAVYLPMVLDVRDRGTVESREVVAEFRRVGILHLFAISGMNVALIFGMLMLLQRPLLARLQPGQGIVHAGDAARAAAVGLIWLYIAVIGLPLPAVRAAIMGTALVWLESRGARTPPLYVLAVTGLAMLAFSPSQLYDVSFQLSFFAYAALVLALELAGPGPAEPSRGVLRRWLQRGLWLGALNLGVTGFVTLALWPLIAAHFGTFSWLVFAGNLLLVPAMGALILPSAMAALALSACFAGSAPGGWIERALFGWVETCLAAWLWLLRAVDHVGRGATFRVPADWSAAQGALYYAALLALAVLLIRLRRRSGTWQKAGMVLRGGFDNAIRR